MSSKHLEDPGVEASGLRLRRSELLGLLPYNRDTFDQVGGEGVSGTRECWGWRVEGHQMEFQHHWDVSYGYARGNSTASNVSQCGGWLHLSLAGLSGDCRESPGWTREHSDLQL